MVAETIPDTRIGRFTAEGRRLALMAGAGVDLLLDVGANEGQYAERMRGAGFEGRILSFEPVGEPYAILERRCAAEPRWTCRRLALGDADVAVEINVSGSSQSSSLLGMLPRHVQAVPRSPYVGTETVPGARLDAVWDACVPPGATPYLKLDVQGAELAVLRGAAASLPSVALVEAELSLVPLYDAAPSYLDVVRWLGERGFRLVSLEDGPEDVATGEMLQLDGIFTRRRAG